MLLFWIGGWYVFWWYYIIKLSWVVFFNELYIVLLWVVEFLIRVCDCNGSIKMFIVLIILFFDWLNGWFCF